MMHSHAPPDPEALHCPYCSQLHPEDLETCPATGKSILLDGKYRLVTLLGEGSFGLVWDARNIGTKKGVAIKSLRAEVVGDPVVLSRFFWEATAAGRVHNAHVCDVLDLIKSSDHGPYIVLERLSGRPLESLIQERGRLDPETVLPLMRQALLGLEAVHRAGIVHRDVKPDNIYLHEPAEGRLVVKLLDFGISKFSVGGAKPAMTASELFMGTPEYMSPEQARGAAQVDRRTDIWAVGAVLYRALSGAPPFDGPDVPSVLTAILHTPHVPLAQAAPHLPPGLGAIIDRCLHKDREQRYATCAELSAALAPFEGLQAPQTLFAARAWHEPTGRAAAHTILAGDSLRETDPDASLVRGDRLEQPRRILLGCNAKDRRWVERLLHHFEPRLSGSLFVLAGADGLDAGTGAPDAASAFAQTRAVVLLVSPEFLAEEFLPGNRLYAFTVTAHGRGVSVLWLAVRGSIGDDEDLRDFDALGDPSRPLDGLNFVEAETALESICDALVAGLGGPWAHGRTPALEIGLEGNGDLDQQLQAARSRKSRLKALGQDTRLVREEINAIRRLLRMGRPLQHGDVLDDRFVVLEQLGSGGFATVWRALDQSVGAAVAIKVLHAQHAYLPDRRERFFRGARIMALLEHPNIVRIIEPWASDGEYEYFVMEYVSGGTLRDAVLAGRIDISQRIEVLLAVSDALAFAHERGIVHRDVKPSNILVSDDRLPYLSDFDLVRTQDTTGGTAGGLGTVIYAAPEMMERAGEADARADVYGLGMTLAFLFFERDLTMEVIRNTDRLVASIAAPEAIRMVIRTAITWNRDHRFRTAAEFRLALAAAVSHAAIPRPRPPTAPRGPGSTTLAGNSTAPQQAPLTSPAPSTPADVTDAAAPARGTATNADPNSPLVQAFTAIARESDKLGDLAVSEVFAALEVHDDDAAGAGPEPAPAAASSKPSISPTRMFTTPAEDDLTSPDRRAWSPRRTAAVALGIVGATILIYLLFRLLVT